MDQSLEEWRPVVGYEGRYEVSSLGRIKSLQRTCSTKGGSHRSVPERILKPAPDGNGYMAVPLAKDGKTNTVRVCRIVMVAFVGPRPEGFVVAHGSKGKLCDSLDNLAYKTQSQNCGEDKLRDDTHCRGERSPKARLNEAQVRFARKAVSRGHATSAGLACAWEVSPSTVNKAVTGKNWGWLNA